MSEAHKEVMAEKLLELEARLLGELNQDTQDTRVAVGIKVSAAKPEFDFSGMSRLLKDASSSDDWLATSRVLF